MPQLVRRKYGSLDCHVITAERPQLVAVISHGFGASGDDLVPIGAELLKRFPTLLEKVVFVFPAAPIPLDHIGLHGGRCWWPLDLEKLATGTRNFEEMREQTPPDLVKSRNMVLELIEELKTEHSLSNQHFVLGGFSQGAMLSTDLSLHLDSPPRAVVIWSGALINEPEWKPRVAQLKDVPVLQSHGETDPILPMKSAQWLNELLTAGGADVEFIKFPGVHTIPQEALLATGKLLERLLTPKA